MEKKGQILEIIIKAIYAVFAIVATVCLIINMVHYFPFLKGHHLSEVDFNVALYKSQIGKIYNDAGSVNDASSQSIGSILYAFIANIEWISIVFLVLTLALSIVYFIFTKWTLVKSYLVLSFILFGSYLVKYILVGLCILIFFKDDTYSLISGVQAGAIFYYIVALGQLFILSLWIIKFVFNISNDIKNLASIT